MRTYPHSEYYRDRSSETELCNDFPLDRMYIEGLYAMQAHMWNNGVNLDIPVVRVMNTAHFLAAYMFATTCTGEQLEYDAMANMSLGRDGQLFKVAIIVLAAMLERTEGFRAQACRNMLLENRDPDFDEGVTLYDRFLKSAQRRFEEEDFLIDTHVQIQKLIAENEQLAAENIQLKWTITTMEEKYTQINIGTQNNNCTQIGTQYNITYVMPATNAEPQDVQPEPVQKEASFFCRITKVAYDKGMAETVEAELRSACVSAPKLIKALRTNEALGYLDTQNLSSVDLYELLNKHFQLPFKLRTFQENRSK